MATGECVDENGNVMAMVLRTDLIAAAPDMLAACRSVVENFDKADNEEMCDELVLAAFLERGGVEPLRDAIAKAGAENRNRPNCKKCPA